MIVYYDEDTGIISGLSYNLVEGRNESYIETSDPIAEKIFLGQEKISKYKVIVRGTIARKGFLVPRNTSSPVKLIRNKIYFIEQNNLPTEIKLYKNLNLKTIKIKIDEYSLEWWKTDHYFSKKSIFITACLDNDPYLPLWSKAAYSTDFENGFFEFSYIGSSDFCLYTDKFFESYSYEVTSI
jgi:hypothetical protein